MSQSRVKQIRKEVYGSDFSPRFRKYKRNTKTGQITADPKRQAYQKAKRQR